MDDRWMVAAKANEERKLGNVANSGELLKVRCVRLRSDEEAAFHQEGPQSEVDRKKSIERGGMLLQRNKNDVIGV
jgi:hypothetical protein